MNRSEKAYVLLKKGSKKIYHGVKSVIFPFEEYIHAEPSSKWKKDYAKYRVSEKIEDNWVFYEAHAGSGMVCNPLAIFKAFQRMPEFDNYLHIWAIRDEEERILLEEEYKNCKNVMFVNYLSKGYGFFLAKAKYLINNTSYPAVFSKREGQVYVSTWHSITVKSLGYDIPDGRKLVGNMLRNLLMADYVISPNRFMTDIFNNAFRLREISTNKFLEIGYPRNDLVVNSDREEILNKLERRGTRVDRNKKIILYAPTWNSTGNNVNKPIVDVQRYQKIYSYLSEHVDMEEYQLLIKPHQIEYRAYPQEEKFSGKYISYTNDANELLSVVDILITDYSSIYFDFMVANKPILMYMPDFEAYSKNRGLYFSKDQLPGPCCHNLEELAYCINNIDKVAEEYRAIRESTQAWACEFDDGRVSEKVLDIVFRGNRNYNIKTANRTDKKRILMYIGQLATNGMTSAAISLLKALDYSKYDVTLFVMSLKTEEQNINFEKIPDQVRTVVRTGTPNFTKEEKTLYNEAIVKGIPEDPNTLKALRKVMRCEFSRIFGNAEFDYIVDFSGYGPFFPALAFLGYAGKNDVKRYMWQHSDMHAEYANTEKSALVDRQVTLESLCSCYAVADKIVSASEAVCANNRSYCATEKNAENFIYANNLLDTGRISTLLSDTSVECRNDCIMLTTKRHENGIKECMVIPYDPTAIHFVTMGRCMPEKNHANLIRAIHRMNQNGQNAMLYIIGDGLLRGELESLAAGLGIADKVMITGILQNPFALLKVCDCFVFPSLYEAQGLAVLEARTVGLPIIVSNYDAVSAVLLEDKQFLLNGMDADAIYEGLVAYKNGKVPKDYSFNLEDYNKKSLEEFELLFT